MRALDFDGEVGAGERFFGSYVAALSVTVLVIAAGSWAALRAPRLADELAPRVPAMIHVAGGPLTLHDRDGTHVVHVRSLDVDVSEVTVAAYRACVDAGACKAPWRPAPRSADQPVDEDGDDIDLEGRERTCNFGAPGRLGHPMNCVSVEAAIDYCQWRGARLPTRSEWLYVAHGGGARTYPWGEARPTAALLNACGHECGGHSLSLFDETDGFESTSPVGAYPAGRTPEGLLDMAGNVSELVCNLDPDQEHLDNVACWTFTDLGGSYRTEDARGLQPDQDPGRRYFWHGGSLGPDIGFRCVR